MIVRIATTINPKSHHTHLLIMFRSFLQLFSNVLSPLVQSTEPVKVEVKKKENDYNKYKF